MRMILPIDPLPQSLTREQAWMVLNGLQAIGPVSIRRLLEGFGDDPVAVLEAGSAALQRIEGIGPKAAAAICSHREQFSPERECQLLDQHRARFVSREDPDYPNPLRDIYDPPTGLYVSGSLPLNQPGIAIVGSRKCSLYGQRIARKLASALARRGFCIVSGLARGIDTAAHEGALEVGGKTFAVLGNGLDIVYPPENLDLMRRIAAEGAILSEFRFGRRADRQSFPMRNRLVAGLARWVVVVETDLQGGSMITARFALEQGREVAAVPGRLEEPQSRGCLQLIQDGATLIHDLDAFVDEVTGPRQVSLPGLPGTATTDEAQATPPVDLTESEHEVFKPFLAGDRHSIDSLSGLLGRPVHEVASRLVLLELKRLIAKRADGTYEKR